MTNKLILKKPLISERASDLASEGKYVFMVEPHANKKQVSSAVEEVYKVKVNGVNMIRVRSKGNTYKKAIVTLKSGDTIDIIPQA